MRFLFALAIMALLSTAAFAMHDTSFEETNDLPSPAFLAFSTQISMSETPNKPTPVGPIIPPTSDPTDKSGGGIEGKGTPGLPCANRVKCGACLRLSYCLWNVRNKSCVDKSQVAKLPKIKQWNHVATCNKKVCAEHRRRDTRDTTGVVGATLKDQKDAAPFVSDADVAKRVRTPTDDKSIPLYPADHVTGSTEIVKMIPKDKPVALMEAETTMENENEIEAEAEAEVQVDEE